MARLSKREQQVVELLAQGKKQKEISSALLISRSTVEAHLRSARLKTGTSSAFELAVKVAIEARTKAP